MSIFTSLLPTINSRDFKNRRIRYRYKVSIDIRESDKFSGANPANLYSVCGSSEELGKRIEDEKCNCVAGITDLRTTIYRSICFFMSDTILPFERTFISKRNSNVKRSGCRFKQRRAFRRSTLEHLVASSRYRFDRPALSYPEKEEEERKNISKKFHLVPIRYSTG